MPWLYVSCKRRGLIYINGSLVGECGAAAVNAPVSEKVLYITFAPLCDDGGAYVLPMTRKLNLLSGVDVCSRDGSVVLTSWGSDVYEATLRPPVITRGASMYMSDVYQLGADRAYAYCAGSAYLCVEGENAFMSPLPAFDRIDDIGVINGGLVVQGAAREGRIIAVYSYDGGWQEDMCAQCEAYAIDGDVLTVYMADEYLEEVKRAYVYQLDGGARFVRNYAQFTGDIDSSRGRALDFLVKALCREESAMEYVSPGLKREFDFEELTEFFEDFVAVRTPISKKGECEYALVYRLAPCSFAARVFSFVFAGGLIDDVIEL